MPLGSTGEFSSSPATPASTTPLPGTVTQVAKTPSTGFAFGAGANETILAWTAPNDGQMHQVNWVLTIIAGAAGTTGGAVRMISTAGGNQAFASINGGTLSANQVVTASALNSLAVDPGTTVTLQQQGGLVAGAATAYASFIAA